MEETMVKRTSRKRRALLLRERVTVIEMYSTRPRPNYDTLAKMFDCGRSQIKNILRQKGQILQEYHKNPESERVRRKVPPILLALNRIVDEWLQRALGHKIKVSSEMILQKSVLVQKFLDYDEFEPTKAWLRSFKRRHGYYRIDLRSLVVPVDTTKSLKVFDIFQDIKNHLDYNIKRAIELKLQGENNNCELSPKRDEPDEEIDAKDTENYKWDFSREEFPFPSENNETVVLRDNSEALDYLRPLEEFAMLTDNFRAIGLISQLEATFRMRIKTAEEVRV